MGDAKKARAYLEEGKTFGKNLDLLRRATYYNYLYKIDSIDGFYKNSIKNLTLMHKYADSAYSIDQRKKVNELLVKYEASKKDKNIKLLFAENQLQRIKTKESNRTKNIILASAILMLIIIGLLFNRYTIKRKSNLTLQANQRELDQKNLYLESLNNEQRLLIKEKEWLIKEVHHRVKNNLQMVTSLLYSQSVYLEDAASKLAIKDSLRRMQAMSLIHQKLYQDENVSTISMPDYIKELTRYLHESFDLDNKITFELDIRAVDLDVAQAIPLGLIITESIVNALKYAFINGQRGTVWIVLEPERAGFLKLTISDNGGGFQVGYDKSKTNSLGIELMNGLARQLKGKFEIRDDQGIHISLLFEIMNK